MLAFQIFPRLHKLKSRRIKVVILPGVTAHRFGKTPPLPRLAR